MNAIVQIQKPSLLARMAERFGIDPDKMLGALKATAFKGDVSNEQMMALLVVAEQYGLNPWTKEIYAFPSRAGVVPVVGVDGWARIINSNPQFDGMDFFDGPGDVKGPDWIECKIYRKDREHPTVVREYMVECNRGTDPWKSHPRRMLRHKAMIQAARLAFGFVGIYDEDESARIMEAERKEAGRLDPRGDVTAVDHTLRDERIEELKRIMRQDKDEYAIADDLREYETQALQPFHELYIAVQDKLASDKIISKAKFKEYLRLQRPPVIDRATVLTEREPGSDDDKE